MSVYLIKTLRDWYRWCSLCVFSPRGGELTIPPSWTSWSSAKMRMMLLGLLGSAHLTQWVSSAESSARSGRAARCPLCRTPAAPDPIRIIRLAIRPPRRRACSNTHSHCRTRRRWARFRFSLRRGRFVVESVSARWTHAHRTTQGVWGSGVEVWPSCDQSGRSHGRGRAVQPEILCNFLHSSSIK